jgi:hypothetical protein
MGFPRGQFGPSMLGHRGFTPTLRTEGQLELDFLPLSDHEFRVLLIRFIVRAFSEVRLPSLSTRLVSTPNMPSADFCLAIGGPLDLLSPSRWTTKQTSQGKLVRPSQHTRRIYALAPWWIWTSWSFAHSSGPARLVSGSCSSGRRFAPRFLQTSPREFAPALR